MKIKEGTIVSFRNQPHVRGTVIFIDPLRSKYRYLVRGVINGKSEDEFFSKEELIKPSKDFKEKESEYNTLRQQTETFWLLQLQMLEKSTFMLQMELLHLFHSRTYVKNKHTKKFGECVFNFFHFHKLPQDYTENERQCLATHLALQSSGVEE